MWTARFTALLALAAVATVYFAWQSYQAANSAANAQKSAAIAQEKQTDRLIVATAEQAEGIAPLLPPGSPDSLRGKETTAYAPFGSIQKRADLLWVLPSRRYSRLIVPLVNSGRSVALIVGVPARVTDCHHEPQLLARDRQYPFGAVPSAVLSAGDSDQVPFVPGDRFRQVGWVAHHKYGWDFQYRRLGSATSERVLPTDRLIIWYTDEGKTTLDWVCVHYRPVGRPTGFVLPSQWITDSAYFGSEPWPSWLRRN